MGRRIGLILAAAFFIVFFSIGLGFSQETDVQENEAAPEQAVLEEAPAQEPVVEADEGADTQWVWGEVVNASQSSSEITLKYFDYDTDQDKEITIAVDPDTLYENASSLSGIKKGDNVSIDYVVVGGGEKPKNLAKNITLEPEEAAGTEGEGQQIMVPEEEMQPVEGEKDLPVQEDEAGMENETGGQEQ